MKKLRGYIFSRPFLGERVPQHIQNLVLREYCSRKKLQFLLSFVEYRFENSSLMLEKVLNETGLEVPQKNLCSLRRT